MSKRPGKILVVDDDKVVLRAVTEILQREGYTVVAIDDAVEGLAASKDPTVDVAVLDIRMPHLSGMDLLRAIKQARADVEVVMMTAFATVETAVEAVKAGAYDYLTKPFANIDEVSLTVAKALERKQLKDRTRVLEEQLSVKGSVRGPDWPVGPDAGGVQAGGDGQLLLGHRADPGRERHRQGAGGPGHPLPQPAEGQAVRRGELLGAHRHPARVRAVRPREGLASPAPPGTRRVSSRPPTAGPSSSTRSATCRLPPRSVCSACCRKAR